LAHFLFKTFCRGGSWGGALRGGGGHWARGGRSFNFARGRQTGGRFRNYRAHKRSPITGFRPPPLFFFSRGPPTRGGAPKPGHGPIFKGPPTTWLPAGWLDILPRGGGGQHQRGEDPPPMGGRARGKQNKGAWFLCCFFFSKGAPGRPRPHVGLKGPFGQIVDGGGPLNPWLLPEIRGTKPVKNFDGKTPPRLGGAQSGGLAFT